MLFLPMDDRIRLGNVPNRNCYIALAHVSFIGSPRPFPPPHIAPFRSRLSTGIEASDPIEFIGVRLKNITPF
jgi:hypothetical protein